MSFTSSVDKDANIIKFGIAIRPFTRSDSIQIVCVFKIAATKTVIICRNTYGFQADAPNKNCAHLAPYNPQPKIVAIAKQDKKKDSGIVIHSPYASAKADIVNNIPVSFP